VEVFQEWTSETRTEKGWVKDSGAPNEAFDLHVDARAGCVLLKAERINWKRPPKWAVVPGDREPGSAGAQASQSKPAPASRPSQSWVKKPRKSWMRR
jgi:phage terminase large subunit GpA-like protein